MGGGGEAMLRSSSTDSALVKLGSEVFVPSGRSGVLLLLIHTHSFSRSLLTTLMRWGDGVGIVPSLIPVLAQTL